MAADFYGAIVAWSVCLVVTIAVSAVTEKKPLCELEGLIDVRRSRVVGDRVVTDHPWVAATVIAVICVVLHWWFW